MEVILETPLKTALNKMTDVLILIEQEMLEDSIQFLHEVRNDATTAFYYAIGQGAKFENLEKASLANMCCDN